jgi:3-oxoacyl-[acyl-carrier protein] reductase
MEGQELNFRLNGKSALVTGAGGGIGRGVALALAKAGARVTVNDINKEEAARTACLIREGSGTADEDFADITDAHQVGIMVSEAQRRTGQIDILVNNAGIIRDSLIEKMGDEAWNEVLKLDLTGAFNCTRAVVPGMIARKHGRIINISSMSYRGNVGQVNYCAAKAGIVGMTRGLGLELAPKGITVNCIAPGLIDTPGTQSLGVEVRERLQKRIPLRSLGEPRDVAAAVLFFASDEARYITRQVLHVSGGVESM